MVHIYGFFKSLKKKPLNWRNPTSQICSGMRSESKKRTLELSLIQGFSCVKSIYVLSLVVPPGIVTYPQVAVYHYFSESL